PAWSALYSGSLQNAPVQSSQRLALPLWWLKSSPRKSYHRVRKTHHLKPQYDPDCSNQYSKFVPAHPALLQGFHPHINAHHAHQNWTVRQSLASKFAGLGHSFHDYLTVILERLLMFPKGSHSGCYLVLDSDNTLTPVWSIAPDRYGSLE